MLEKRKILLKTITDLYDEKTKNKLKKEE